MKVTNTQRRKGSSAHNSRYTQKKLDHVDDTKTDMNLMMVQNENGDLIVLPNERANEFKKMELAAYERLFGEHQRQQNAKYQSKGQKCYQKDISELYKGKRTQPMEAILQLGKNDEFSKDSLKNRRDFLAMINDYISSIKKRYPQIEIYSCVIHVDECSLHAHLRFSIYELDDKNVAHPRQEKGLEQMDIELPNITQPTGRYNNRLMTFTQKNRELWAEIVKKIRPEIELNLIPDKKRRKKHLEKIDYQIESAMEKYRRLEILIRQKEEFLENLDDVEGGIERARSRAKNRAR